MTSILGAIDDDHSDYVSYCEAKGVEPMKIRDGNFYKTKEWADVRNIPHFKGCLEMELKEKEEI